MALYRSQASGPSLRKRNAKRLNVYLRRPYKVAMKRREVKGKGEKKRYIRLNIELQRTKGDKKAFLSDQCKEIEENNRMGKTSL